jgi:glycine betaine/choline ABC-type transport system substrate-binding protein
MRIPRMLALGASVLALALGACSTGGGSSAPGQAKLKLAVATDCQTNPVCGQALKAAYNIDVTNATKLAACDTPMAQALLGKTIDVAELCSTQPDIAVNNWVVLDDDKHTQPADNIAPLVRDDYLAKLSDKAGFEKILNDVSAAMDTKTLTDLGKQIAVDKKDVAPVAKSWLQSKSFTASAGAGASAPTLKVGSDGFYEAKLMAEIYAQALEANGYRVDRTGIGIGARKVSAPALESGQIELKPEYIGSGLAFYTAPAAAASGSPAASAAASATPAASGSPAASFSAGDPAAVAQRLAAVLQPKGITVLDYSPAADQNAFVVRKETADQYHLTKMSDLAQYLQQ